MGQLAQEYNAEVCLTESPWLVNNKTALDFPKPGECLYGEPDMERLMKRNDLAADQLKWIWLNWHNSVGPRLKENYQISIRYQNKAANNNGKRAKMVEAPK